MRRFDSPRKKKLLLEICIGWVSQVRFPPEFFNFFNLKFLLVGCSGPPKGEMRSSTTLLPATEFPAHPEAAAFAKSIDDFLEETKVQDRADERMDLYSSMKYS
jgi:hypothetical protein